MNRTSLARERNSAISHLMIVAFVAACGMSFLAFGFYGFNRFDFSEMTAVVITGFGFALIVGSGIPAVPAIWTLFAMNERDDDSDGSASDMLLFPVATQPPPMRMEARTDDNQLRRCKYQFDRAQWHRLVVSLADNRWRFTRDAVVRAKVFNATNTPGTSPTAPGHFDRICREFERMDLVERVDGRWKATQDGRLRMSRAAGIRVVI